MTSFFNYEKFINFSKSKMVLYISLIWGICEAIFFFVVPDLFFMIIALLSPKRGILCSVVSVLGSVIGGSIIYFLTLIYPDQIIDFLSLIPLISAKLILFVHDSLARGGLTSMFAAPFKGIPYKIYAVQAAHLGFNFFEFILITVLVRLERVLLLASICGGIGKFFKKNISLKLHIWICLYLLLWIIFYSFYAYNMTHAY